MYINNLDTWERINGQTPHAIHVRSQNFMIVVNFQSD